MAVDILAEEVAGNLEEVAQVTRRLSGGHVGFFIAGIGVGAAVGVYLGYRYDKKKIKAEILAEAEEDVKKIREYYRAKLIAAQEKPTVEAIVRERGYAPSQDEDAEDVDETVGKDPGFPSEKEIRDKLRPYYNEDQAEALRSRPLPPPVPIGPDAESRVSLGESWNQAAEQARRSYEAPYIIHREEFNRNETDYPQLIYTYFAGDDVIVDKDNVPLVAAADSVVGRNNLRFGHGSGDSNVVFVRNDKLELEMEIVRSPASYEEEVLGLQSDESGD